MPKILINNGKFIKSGNKLVLGGGSGPAPWVDPVQDGDKVTIQSVYSATQDNNTLEVQ